MVVLAVMVIQPDAVKNDQGRTPAQTGAAAAPAPKVEEPLPSFKAIPLKSRTLTRK